MGAIAVRELVTIWGFKVNDKPLKKMEVGIKNVTSSLAIVGASAAAGAATLFGLAKNVATTGENISLMAAKTGVSTDSLQELTFAAEQAGLAQSDLTAVLTDLSNKSFSVIEGNQKQALAFRRLGVQVANSAGDLRDADEVLLDLADSFARLPDGAEKTVLATQALGGAGAKLIPFLNKGRAGISEMREEARRLGVVLGKDTIDASVRFQQSLKKSLAAITGIKNTIGAELLPVVQEIIDEFRIWVVENRKLIATNVRRFIEILKSSVENFLFILKNMMKVLRGVGQLFGGLENAIKAVSAAVSIFLALKFLSGLGAIALAVKGLALQFLFAEGAAIGFDIAALLIPVAIGAFIAILALLAEDVIAFFQGRDSILGRAIKVLKEDFPVAWEVLKSIFNLMGSILDNIGERFSQVMDFAINQFQRLIDFVSGTIIPFFKDSFIGDLFGKIGQFFSGGKFKTAIDAANQAVKVDTALLQGRDPASSLGGETQIAGNNTNINQNFSINADGLTKEEAVAAIESGVAKSMSTTLRETERDVTPAVER